MRRRTGRRKFSHNQHIILDCACVNQDNMEVVHGTAEVLAPAEKVKTKRVDLPHITISKTSMSISRGIASWC